MERMAAFHADLEPLGVGRSDLVETTARIIHQTVTGQTVTGQTVTGQTVTGQTVTGQTETGQAG
jgi:hypothetical protein